MYDDLTSNGRDKVVTDLVAIIRSFAARVYDQRRVKRKTESTTSCICKRVKNYFSHLWAAGLGPGATDYSGDTMKAWMSSYKPFLTFVSAMA